MSEPSPPLSTDLQAPRIERAWIWFDEQYGALVSFTKPNPVIQATEYMRVLSRQEVEKLANDHQEGVDVQQYISSLVRTIEGQRKHINRLEQRIANLQEIVAT